MQVPQINPIILTNQDAFVFYKNEASRIKQIYNNHASTCHAKGALAGISSLASTGISITAAAVVIHSLKLGAAMIVLGALSTAFIGIVAITASIIWWALIVNQSDAFKTEKENELRSFHNEVLKNITKDPNYYKDRTSVSLS